MTMAAAASAEQCGMAISTKDDLFVSLIESAVIHFEEAHEHDEEDNFDATFSSVAVGLESITIAEAMKRNVGDIEAADLLLKKHEEYIEFSEHVQNRRQSLGSIESFKKDNKIVSQNSPPLPPSVCRLKDLMEGIKNQVENSTTNASDDDEVLGNSLVIEALTLDEKGNDITSLPLYIKAVEKYLSFLDRKPLSPNIVNIVGEVLDRIEQLRNDSNKESNEILLQDDKNNITTTNVINETPSSNVINENENSSSNYKTCQISGMSPRRFSKNADLLALVDNYPPRKDSTSSHSAIDQSPFSPSLTQDDDAMLKQADELKKKDSAWLSSIWSALKLNIKVPHQGTGDTPAPYAKLFKGTLPCLTPPALGTHQLRQWKELKQIQSCSSGGDVDKKVLESTWARCKACGAFVAREVKAIEKHIVECEEGGAVAPYEGIRVITWNMERGYRLGSIIEELTHESPDIVLLQEVDVGCRRSYCNDTGAEIAVSLGMHIAFASEKDHVNTKKDHTSPSSLLTNVSNNNNMETCVEEREKDVETVEIIQGKEQVENIDEVNVPPTVEYVNSGVDEDTQIGSCGNSSSCDHNVASTINDNSNESISGTGVEGIAVLSRYPIISVRTIHLPAAHRDDVLTSSTGSGSSSAVTPNTAAGDTKSRTALRVETETPIGLVVAYCCHLDAFAGRTARVHQLQPVLEDAKITTWEAIHVRKLDKKPHIIIGGDFNTHNHGIARLSRKMSGNEGLSGIGMTEAQWWDDYVFANSGLKDPFNKSDDSHNTWISVAGLTVWGGKIDWLLFSESSLVCDAHHISQGGKSSDHPLLRVDLRKAPEI